MYPYGQTAAHILGYCQKMSEENSEQYISAGYDYNDYIGVSGVEATMEKYLTGCSTEHHGSTVVKTNANKSVIEVLSVTPPTDGSDVTLTIDLSMQLVVENALKDIIQNINQKQQALIDAGYKSYVRSADGIYGQWTYDAVRAYQRDVGLSVDGIAGKNTQNKLYGTKY